MIYLLPHTILASADRDPTQEAFRCAGAALTYAELVQRADQLATVLYDFGVRRGDRVGIFLGRSLETAVAIFGILRCGAVYVPLNPKAPESQNHFLLQDCGIRILVTHPSQRRSLLKLLGARPQVQGIVGMSEVEDYPAVDWPTVFAAPPATFAVPRQVETDLAYLIYTSGSTGQPKGIMHSHASGLAFVRNAAARYAFGPQDRFGNHAPIYFDISQLAYFGAPLVGATAVLATDAHTVLPASLGRLFGEERLTVWYSVPLAITQLLNAGALAGQDLTSLRYLFYAGEPLAPRYARQLAELLPTTRIANWYGPAETNVCTVYDLPGPPQDDASIPIGEVWDNTERLIVDDQDQPVATGNSGELLIRATTNMLGYWNQVELSTRAWYTHVTQGGSTERFYRTGDLVREDPVGVLHFLGRRDHQVKIRGYRVELSALEAHLLTHPAVAEAAAVTVQRQADALSIVVAVILRAGDEATVQDLQEHLAAAFPWYALPESLYLRESFPRTGSDKIDRPALQSLLADQVPS
ncbi:amino acid adenylation domain-containing protein [Neolewinella lacunae]|uniref:Amino acid adenylation domain-containing protein n=1 Tax=Neolewinella lacunae TaxID=1517758 RepID=A0A923PHB8_9BACT|nr:amino acid adenylation domain-containing protein [Neolewinella lacunae]MBC6994133.1 amino acid adenylation domain-containing protein [Neolewinella lacunae]MDN3636718.1 amino acid adenylation domain-containing protein [Neolewinella lacunae]